MMLDDLNIAGLEIGNERYIVIYDDRHAAEATMAVGRFASNPELRFTWPDAVNLANKIRNNMPKAKRDLGIGGSEPLKH